MNANTLVTFAFAVVGFAGISTVGALAQERPLGHESAVGPGAGAHGPGATGEGREPRGPAGMGEGREAPGPVHPGGPGAAPPAAGRRPAMGPGLGHGPQGPAFGQRPMTPPAAPAMRPNNGPAGVQNFGQGRAPAAVPRMEPRAPRGPIIDHAPRAHGAVPAPYRGNIHRFVDMDARVWRGGRWHHSHHDGQFGWWWVVGGLWYFYPQPVYPYPDPFVPGTIDYGPDASGQYWYYCESAGQYYPYVTYCPEGWEAVVPDPDQ